MLENCASSFEEQVRLLRIGDAEAIRIFVDKYEPYIRRTIRFRLQRSVLQPAADSVDICQSVMGSVLLRLVAGEYELRSELDLRNLLIAVANKKFLMLARHESAAKRDRGRTRYLSDLPERAETHVQDPSQPMICQELLAQVAARLSAHEAELLRMRRQGLSWTEIASQLNDDPTVLRQRLSRALRSVAAQLGIA
ncbi:MAG: hypothetical protein ABI557_00680 [Aureliella sp.]